ncbi:acyl-CoA dehydrogenase family protein, partial [Streptomyces sp. GC420]
MNQDFDLYRPSEEHEMLRESVRALAEAKIAPFAAEVDEAGRFPRE